MEWAPKRFYETASVEVAESGFAVRLDDRPVRTPGKALLALPTRPMAEKIATEWEAQQDRIDPRTMPWTRSANSAIDKIAAQRVEVEDHLIGYAGTDLLCYRADAPESLVARQGQIWDPILDWAMARFGVALRTTMGVMPVAQSPETLAALRAAMAPMSDFHLMAFHDLVGLSGSYVIGLAAVEDLEPPDALWAASRLDEDWQAEQWGVDEEAAAEAEIRRSAYLHATEFYRLA